MFAVTEQHQFSCILTVACVAVYSLFRYLYLLLQNLHPPQIYADAPIVCVNNNSELPRARDRFRTDAKSMLREGYNTYKGYPFYVPTPLGERLMVPSRYVEELKSAPVKDIDFVGTFFEMYEGRYTTMGSRSTLHPRVARNQLNQHLDEILRPVTAEIQESIDELFPLCEEWTPLPIAEILTELVARVSSRMFGGRALSKNTNWLKAAINFAVDGFFGAQKIKKYPLWLRPLVSYWIPELRRIRQHHKTARDIIVPLLKERQKSKTGIESDFLGWMLEAAFGDEAAPEFLAAIQLKLSFAAIHTSAAAPTQLIYDLCVMPEKVTELREEMDQVLGDRTPLLSSKQSLNRLVKMDSLMKESQRFNPLLLVTFERIVTSDYTLKDGFIIPANTTIGVPTEAIAHDPELYPEPEKFDSFRFCPKDGNVDKLMYARSQYAASNLDSMAFGYGRHACPGRFFASCEIKLIMIHLLKHFDLRLPDGLDERPASVGYETQYLPDPSAQVLFKKRMGQCR